VARKATRLSTEVTDVIGPIDFYEDEGALLASTTTVDEIPAFVKTARYAAEDPADTFALVLLDEQGATRCLYSLADPGNTALSAHYLLHSDLPDAVAKTAALNIGARLVGFSMDVPDELLALAGVQSAGELRAIEPFVVTKVAADSAEISSDGQVQFKAEGGKNIAAGTPTSYAGAPRYKGAKGSKGYAAAAQKMASLDTVLAAVDRFEEDCRLYAPEDRVSLGGVLKQAAREHGIALGPKLSLYSDGVFDLGHAMMSIEARHSLVPHGRYDDLAKVATLMDAARLPDVLRAMDMEYGIDRLWDSMLPDPVASVMVTKVAEMLEGVTTITSSEAVENMALVGRETLRTYFKEDMVNSFQKNPVAAFKALPDPQRELVARLAQSLSSSI
jgi:hypothetical protein